MTMPTTRVSVADTSDARGLAKGNGTPLGADSGAEGTVAAPQWGPRGWEDAVPGTRRPVGRSGGRAAGSVSLGGRRCRVMSQCHGNDPPGPESPAPRRCAA